VRDEAPSAIQAVVLDGPWTMPTWRGPGALAFCPKRTRRTEVGLDPPNRLSGGLINDGDFALCRFIIGLR